MSLLELITKQIQQQGPMPFVDFMHQALYHPEWGYYNSALPKLGPGGDFITAPEISPLFGQTLAKQCCEIISSLPSSAIFFEFGAGSGQLCIDILRYCEKVNCLPTEYRILEVSGDLRRRQQQTIQDTLPHLAHRVHWVSAWPDEPFQGVVIANEVLDAMPVHRFVQTREATLEGYVSLTQDGQLQEEYKLCLNSRLINHINRLFSDKPRHYQSEANLFIDDWLQQLYTRLERGAIILIDYGFPAHEYYHPDRDKGTLMCHYQHQSHTNALQHLGEQDITAHVDFTHVADAAFNAGFHVAGFTTQAFFLLNNGLLDLIDQTLPPAAQLSMTQAIKKLTHPHEMGELFKVMALTKSIELELSGFKQYDKRVNL